LSDYTFMDVVPVTYIYDEQNITVITFTYSDELIPFSSKYSELVSSG